MLLLMPAIMLLFLDVGRSATILSVLEEKLTPAPRPQNAATPPTPIAYSPLPPSTPVYNPIITPPNDLSIDSKPNSKSKCEKQSATLYVERDGCRPAALPIKLCNGLTISIQAFVGFNDTMPQVMTFQSTCTPIAYRIKRSTLYFVCNGKVRTEKVHYYMPKRCGIDSHQLPNERLSIPTQEPPSLTTTTPDC